MSFEPALPLICLGVIGDMDSNPGGTAIRDVGMVAVGFVLDGTAHFLKRLDERLRVFHLRSSDMDRLPILQPQLDCFVAVHERLIDVYVMSIKPRALQPTAPLVGQLVVRDFHFFPGRAAVDDIDVPVVLVLLHLAAELLDGLEVLGSLLGILEMLFVPLSQSKGDDFGMVMTFVFVAVIVFGLLGWESAGTGQGQTDQTGRIQSDKV